MTDVIIDTLNVHFTYFIPISLTIQSFPLEWLSSTVVKALDFWLEIAGTIPDAALSSATFGKFFKYIAFVAKQDNLAPAEAGRWTGTPCDALAPFPWSCSSAGA